MLIPLQYLTDGACGEIEVVLGSDAEIQRFAELGWKTGAAVQVVQGGSPCIAEVGGQRLCFRPGDGLEVLVRANAVGV
jgi:Fe2+ transport system protein FeoA